MGKSFDKSGGYNDKRAEKEREKERRNLRNKRKMVFEKPQPHRPKDSDSKEYTY